MDFRSQFKKFKFLHWLYNLLHYRSLAHNKSAYKKYALHRPVIASISSRNFPDKTSRAWLDTGDSRQLAPSRIAFSAFSPALQASLLDWSDKGYIIIPQFLDEADVFLARKGDILIWHANLIHGGLPVKDPTLTRKSMVIHYFAKDVIKYHEITERPSLLK